MRNQDVPLSLIQQVLSEVHLGNACCLPSPSLPSLFWQLIVTTSNFDVKIPLLPISKMSDIYSRAPNASPPPTRF